MITVVILGMGNLSFHLYNAFKECEDIQVIQLYNKSIQKLKKFKNEVETTDDYSNLKSADIYIIAVSDDSISSVSEALVTKMGLLVHTSGSVAIETLPQNCRRGVFYPLQTFSKEQKIDFKSVPICIEAERKTDLALLHQLGSSISNQVFEISSNQRKSLHLAAVFINNFTNHLYHMGYSICEENNVPFHILRPLITETANKIEKLSPYEAQTGPARRNDSVTIKSHLNLIKNKQQKEIYTLLSESIKNTYGKEL